MPNLYATDTITVLKAPVEDDGRGNRIPNWDGQIEKITVSGCRVQPMAGEELYNVGATQRDGNVNRMKVFAPLDAPVSYLDRVVWDGTAYQVDGEPNRWRGVVKILEHSEFYITEVTG